MLTALSVYTYQTDFPLVFIKFGALVQKLNLHLFGRILTFCVVISTHIKLCKSLFNCKMV